MGQIKKSYEVDVKKLNKRMMLLSPWTEPRSRIINMNRGQARRKDITTSRNLVE